MHQRRLDRGLARVVLSNETFADSVRQALHLRAVQGVRAVPTYIVDGRLLVSGGQEKERWVGILRSVRASAA
jgi:predicted DsbA family dithiol-disulfide isomerase